MPTVKVSIESPDGSTKKLYDLDMAKSLEENVNSICEVFEQPTPSTVYGLKLISTNTGLIMHTYISEDNFGQVKDGYFLQLVYSLSYLVKRIFEHIDDGYKEKSFSDLLELSVDPEFIKEMVKTDKHFILIDLFTNRDLAEKEATACIIAIVHLFQRHYIKDINNKFLEKIVQLSKADEKRSDELVKYALSVLHKILCHRDPNFDKWKQELLIKLSISGLVQFIRTGEPELQYGALLVINAMIRCCKGEKKQQLVKEINLKQNKEAIYRYIIDNKKVERSMARELYIYQTNLLSLFAEALNSTISVQDSEFFEPTEFEIVDREVKKMTVLMDFDDIPTRNKSNSIENLLDFNDVRISLASMSSKYSENSRFSNQTYSNSTSEYLDYDSTKISYLALEALRHYKKYHYKNFYQSQVEEKAYEPGILVSSERVIRMLASILRIGLEPDRSSTCYQPTVFNCSNKTPFFLELFSRTMWLLSKTRRQMKASTLLDYEKVLYILGKQVKIVLEEKPMDFRTLTEKMVEISYGTVVEKWQKEKQEEFRIVLDTNPSVKVLKERFSKKNEELIFQQRLNYIQAGTVFPKFNEKKINGNFKAKLATNERELIICDYYAVNKTFGVPTLYSLANITHVVSGKACPHVINNSVKEPHLAFSILIDNSQWINFKASDRKMADYWQDGLNLLLGKEGRSDYYKNELKELVEMDLVLYLMDLQNVPIPKRPPPVPQKLPAELKPDIPPKPANYSKTHKKRTSNY